MKRKVQILGWLTAFFALALLWVSPAMATDYELYIAGTQVTDANCNNLGGITGVTVASGGEFKYDPATKALTMKDVTVSADDNSYAIYNRDVEGLKIEVLGSNRLGAARLSTLYMKASTFIEGSGSLIAVSDYVAFYIYKTTITISDITLEATGYYGIAGGNGMENEKLILKNAKVTATGTAAGIARLASFTTEGFNIIIPVGGDFNTTKHAVVDAKGNVAKRVKIAPSIDEYDLHIAGTQVTDLNCDDLSKIEGVTVAAGGEFKYDPVTKALTMKDVTVSVGDGKDAILNRGVEGLKIVVSGTNRIEATDWSALIISASTTIEGSGSFITVCNKESGVSVYIGSEATLTVSDITFEASGKWGIIGSTTLKGKALILRNATVKATGTEAGIADLTSFTTEGCEIVVPTGGKFDQTKHAVVDAEGNIAKEVKIEPAIYVAETRVTNDNCNDLSGITGVTVAADGEFKYDPATKTLYMKNVTVSVGNEKNPIRNRSMEGLKIVVSGTNRLEATNWSSLSCLASTEIKGSGSLTTTSSSGAGVYLAVAKTLTISDITLETSGAWGITGLFGNGNETLILKNANVTATGTTAGIACLASFTTEECEIVVPAGGKFEETKHAVVDAGGNKAKTVKIERIIELYIAGTQVTDANCNDLSGIEGVTVAAGGEFKYDPATKTLTMEDVTVSVGDGKNAIRNEIKGLKIEVSGTNRLEATNWSSLSCLASTEIEGSGSLTTTSSGRVGLFVGSAEVTISDITLAASGERGISGVDGIHGEELVLKNAKVTATGTEAGVAILSSLIFEGCEIISPEGGHFDEAKHAVVDADGNVAKEVKFELVIKLFIAGTQVTEVNCNNLKEIEGVTIAEGGEFKYDPATKTLTMKDVTVSAGDGENAIRNQGVEGLKIEVSGTNRLEATNAPLVINASTFIEGSGTLVAACNGDNLGIFVNSTTLTISDITLEASGKYGIAGWNGTNDEKLILKNAKVTATGTEAGIANLASFTTEGFNIIIPVGGDFNTTKHAVVDAEGNVAKRVKIAPSIDEYDLYIADTQVTEANCNDLSGITGVTVDSGGEFKYDPAEKTLTMKDVTVLAGDGKDAIWNRGVEGLKIVVSGTNRIEATDRSALIISASTTIEGSGSLTATNSSVAGVYVGPTELTISNITLEATGKWGIAGYDGTKNERLILKNAKVTATGTKAGIADLAAFTTEGCEIISPEGGHFDEAKHAVVDADGNKAKEVKIGSGGGAVTGITLSQHVLSLVKGTTATLTAEISPADAPNKNFSWHSDNEAVATVENGVVTAVDKGEAIIRVTTEEGNKTDECKVTVRGSDDIAVTGVQLSPKELTLKVGTSLKLVAKVEPANATNKVVTWQCSDESVASVSDQGLVEAKAAGTSIITVTTADGGHTATCSLTVVTEDVRLTSIKVSPSEMRITVGQNTTLNVSYEPAGATQKAVTWETNDAAIVTVDANGNIKGVAEGEAIITAKSKQDETIKSTCKVVVTPATAVEDTVFASVVIAPNPFGNQLRIVNGELRGEYALLNAQGIVVRSGNADGNEVVIETRDLTSGLYLLRLTATNGATKTYRVVKQ